MQTVDKKLKFDALQVLRGLAAGLVVFWHGVMNWSDKAAMPGPMPNLLAMGDFGVKLFFCISGFIIVHTASNMPAGWASAKTFWRRRIARIVPLYWVLTLAYILKITLSGLPPSIEEVTKSFAFIPYVNPHGLVQPILGQGWSLNYEMLFYLTFGALLLLPRRLHVLAVAGVMLALAGARANGWLGNGGHALYYWADAIILYFVAGMLVCQLAKWWRSRGFPAFSQSGAALACCVLVVGYAGFALPVGEALAVRWMPVLCITLVLLCVTAHAEPCCLAWRPLVIAGDASYSTYLIHGFVMGPLARVLGMFALPGGYYTFACLSLIVCTLVGYLVYIGLERPLHTGRWFKWRLIPPAPAI